MTMARKSRSMLYAARYGTSSIRWPPRGGPERYAGAIAGRLQDDPFQPRAPAWEYQVVSLGERPFGRLVRLFQPADGSTRELREKRLLSANVTRGADA
jgi:hypothetical protein